MVHIPDDLKELLEKIVAYEEELKKEQELEDESGLEYAYVYDMPEDYSDYPEDSQKQSEPKSTIIKIDL